MTVGDLHALIKHEHADLANAPFVLVATATRSILPDDALIGAVPLDADTLNIIAVDAEDTFERSRKIEHDSRPEGFPCQASAGASTKHSIPNVGMFARPALPSAASTRRTCLRTPATREVWSRDPIMSFSTRGENSPPLVRRLGPPL